MALGKAKYVCRLENLSGAKGVIGIRNSEILARIKIPVAPLSHMNTSFLQAIHFYNFQFPLSFFLHRELIVVSFCPLDHFCWRGRNCDAHKDRRELRRWYFLADKPEDHYPPTTEKCTENQFQESNTGGFLVPVGTRNDRPP